MRNVASYFALGLFAVGILALTSQPRRIDPLPQPTAVGWGCGFFGTICPDPPSASPAPAPSPTPAPSPKKLQPMER